MIKRKKSLTESEDSRAHKQKGDEIQATTKNFNPLSRVFRRAYVRNALMKKKTDQPMHFKLNINFVKGSKKTKIIFPNQALERDFDVLRENEEKILKWLASDKTNKIAFALDPIDALYKSKLKIDRRILENIGRFRKSNLKVQPSMLNFRLRTVTVTGPSEKPTLKKTEK